MKKLTFWEAVEDAIPYIPTIGTQRRAVMTELIKAKSRGRTDEEVRTKTNVRRARTRRKELQDLNFVEWNGTYRQTASGREAKVYVVTDLGREAYAEARCLGR